MPKERNHYYKCIYLFRYEIRAAKRTHTLLLLARSSLICKIPQQLGRNKDGNNNPLLCRDEQMGSPSRLFFHSTAAAACKIDSDILTTIMVYKKGADQISVIQWINGEKSRLNCFHIKSFKGLLHFTFHMVHKRILLCFIFYMIEYP